MASPIVQSSDSRAWALARRQHWVVARWQLLELGFTASGVRHRIADGRLHRLWRGVFAVGHPDVGALGRWTGATLACGPEAALSHSSAAALWEIGKERAGVIEASVPYAVGRAHPGIAVHRRAAVPATCHRGIPVTSVACTLVDQAARLDRHGLEAAIGEADKRGLIDPEALRSALAGFPGRPGVARLRETLDRRTLRLTDSRLERLFLPIVQAVGLPLPETRRRVNGFRVDFFWRELGLVVETDGLRCHRTPPSRPGMRSVTRPTPRRAWWRCDSPTRRSSTRPVT